MGIWPYQDEFPWTTATGGRLTDQARQWLNALYKFLSPGGGAPVQIGGDLSGNPAAPIVDGIQGRPVSPAAPADKQVLTWITADNAWEPKTAAIGTVTSVGLAAPAEFTVTNSPVIGSGTLTFAKAVQSANQIYAGPISGGATAPTFRSLATADLPAGTGTVSSVGLSMPAEFTVANSPVTTSNTLAVTKATQAKNLVYAGPPSGSNATPTFRAIVNADLPQIIKVNGTLVGV